MLALLVIMTELYRGVRRSLKDAAFRGLLFLFVFLLILGTVFYMTVEGWSMVDAMYFSVATISTVGYGDIAPTTSLGKVFTILYLLGGAGVFVSIAATLALNLAGSIGKLKDVGNGKADHG